MIEKKRKQRIAINNSNLKVSEYWQARIKILQLPSLPSDLNKPYTNKFNYSSLRSWFVDPLNNLNVPYCMELKMNEGFELTFYITERSRKIAYINGHAILTYLEGNYPGLDGELSVIQCNKLNDIGQNCHFFELEFPQFNPKKNYRFKLFWRMIMLFNRRRGTGVQFFIFWKESEKSKFFWPYSLKIFVKINPTDAFMGKGALQHRLAGQLKFISMGIKKSGFEFASWKRRDNSIWKKITTSWVFENGENITCGGDRQNFDFFFFPEINIRRARYLKNENISFSLSNIDPENSILVGKYIKSGVVSEQKIYIPVEDFEHSAVIGGVPNTGKTTFLSQICEEFSKKAPGIGLLILNIGKDSQEKHFPVDQVISYGDPECEIPYYVEGIYEAKCFQETADYLAGSLGFEEPINKIMIHVMKSYINKRRNLPHYLSLLFTGLVDWIEKNPYHEEYQFNILRALSNRINALFADPYLRECTQLKRLYNTPRWFKEWSNGKNIYMDLSSANLHTSRLLANGIFQMVRASRPLGDINRLKNVICIDEAHRLVGAITHELSDEEIITRRVLGGIFKKLLQEFRSKGLSFIIADQNPSDLISCVTTLPSLKFIFRVENTDSARFTSDLNEREFIKSLRNRNTVVLNGSRGERYVIRTIDKNPII